MSRRSQSNLEFLLFLPWWVSAGLGVLCYLLSASFINSVAQTGGPIGKGIAQGAGWVPFLLLFIFGMLAIGSALIRWKLANRLESQTSIESIRGLSWEAFEGLVAEAYRRKGYAVEQSLVGGADGGVDLVLRKDGQTTLVQCKQWRTSAVGAPVIREVYGVLMHEKANRAIVIASGHFTREAETFAVGKPMELIDGQQLLKMVRGVQIKPRIASPTSVQAQVCPKCGSKMVLRTARRGANAGNSFWGCSSYPACKGTRDA
jgi:restriction system protein